MGKNRDVRSISNSISITILHELLVEHTNYSHSIPHLKKESVEYKEGSLKKIDKRKLNNSDKIMIRNLVIKRIRNRLKTKYSDVKISQKEIFKKVDEELSSFFA